MQASRAAKDVVYRSMGKPKYASKKVVKKTVKKVGKKKNKKV